MNRTSPEERRRIRAGLDRAVQRTDELRAALLEERAALAGQDLDALETALAGKLDAVEAARAADVERRKLMARAGLGGSDSAMPEALEKLDDDGGLADLWKRLGSLARECSVLNAGNGQAIHARRTQVDRRLAVLRGDTEAAPATYGRRGAPSSVSGKQTLAEA